jgi:hypothetical protein
MLPYPNCKFIVPPVKLSADGTVKKVHHDESDQRDSLINHFRTSFHRGIALRDEFLLDRNDINIKLYPVEEKKSKNEIRGTITQNGKLYYVIGEFWDDIPQKKVAKSVSKGNVITDPVPFKKRKLEEDLLKYPDIDYAVGGLIADDAKDDAMDDVMNAIMDIIPYEAPVAITNYYPIYDVGKFSHMLTDMALSVYSWKDVPTQFSMRNILTIFPNCTTVRINFSKPLVVRAFQSNYFTWDNSLRATLHMFPHYMIISMDRVTSYLVSKGRMFSYLGVESTRMSNEDEDEDEEELYYQLSNEDRPEFFYGSTLPDILISDILTGTNLSGTRCWAYVSTYLSLLL